MKAFATLRFTGDRLDPATLSDVLNFRPTQAYRKGETYVPGPRTGPVAGRTGVWYLATDTLIPDQTVERHLDFILKLLLPGPGDLSRIAILRDLMRRDGLKATVTLFWHGRRRAKKPAIPPLATEILKLLPAAIEADFDGEAALPRRAARR